jgi:hypothetical protein
MNLDLVATGYADFWDASHSAPIKYNETGAQTFFGSAWTGTNFAGTNSSGFSIAHSSVRYGNPFDTDDDWVQDSADSATNSYPLYALSETLTVVPEPSTFALAGIGLLALLGFSRKKRA